VKLFSAGDRDPARVIQFSNEGVARNPGDDGPLTQFERIVLDVLSALPPDSPVFRRLSPSQLQYIYGRAAEREKKLQATLVLPTEHASEAGAVGFEAQATIEFVRERPEVEFQEEVDDQRATSNLSLRERNGEPSGVSLAEPSAVSAMAVALGELAVGVATEKTPSDGKKALSTAAQEARATPSGGDALWTCLVSGLMVGIPVCAVVAWLLLRRRASG